MNDNSMNVEEVFDNGLSINQTGNPNIYNLVKRQLDSPKLKQLHVPSTLRNWNSSLAFFKEALIKYAPDDLLIDQLFIAFLDHLQVIITRSELAPSTIQNYSQVLHGNLLVYANVNEVVRKQLKQGMRNIRKRQRQVSKTKTSIDDATLIKWLSNLDSYCSNPDTVPNLFKIANKNSKLAYKEKMSRHHLLLLRGLVWLTIATGARSGEIRSLTLDSITNSEVKRTIYKMKIMGREVTSALPGYILERIQPMLESIRIHCPDATLLFSESDNKKGKGTIDPRLLQELVKGSMIASGMSSTSPGGYYRLHDLRKVWARWIDENGGSLESISAFLTHSSTQVTYKAYFADDHKQRLAHDGQRTGLNHLKSLLSSPMNDMAERLSELRKILSTGGSIYAEHSFGLRHTIKPTESASRSWSPLPDLNRGHPDVC